MRCYMLQDKKKHKKSSKHADKEKKDKHHKDDKKSRKEAKRDKLDRSEAGTPSAAPEDSPADRPRVEEYSPTAERSQNQVRAGRQLTQRDWRQRRRCEPCPKPPQ